MLTNGKNQNCIVMSLHWHFEYLKCPPLASTRAFSCFEKSLTALSIGPCGRLSFRSTEALPWVRRLFSALLRFVISLQHCSDWLHPTHDSPRGWDPANLEATDPLQPKSGHLARSHSSALLVECAGAPSCSRFPH